MSLGILQRIVGDKFVGASCLFLLLVLSELGCTDPLLSTGKPVIRGHVSYHGAPLRSGKIVFSHPDPKSMDVWGIAPIRQDGSYEVDMDAGGNSLPTGWYQIAVWPVGHEGIMAAPVIGGSKPLTGPRKRDRDEDEAIQKPVAAVETPVAAVETPVAPVIGSSKPRTGPRRRHQEDDEAVQKPVAVAEKAVVVAEKAVVVAEKPAAVVETPAEMPKSKGGIPIRYLDPRTSDMTLWVHPQLMIIDIDLHD